MGRKLGILGGGQLARMLSQAAIRMGHETYVLSASQSDCARPVCSHWIRDDGSLTTLEKFAQSVETLVIENEFLDLKKLKKGTGRVPLYPPVSCLELVQDKFLQKVNLQRFGIPTAEMIEIRGPEDGKKVIEKFGNRFVVKKSQLGYDGRGTFVFDDNLELKMEFFAQNPNFKGYAEPYVAFKKELSVVLARSVRGEVRVFPIVETFQENGMCLWVRAPAEISPSEANSAREVGVRVIENFGGVGVFAVEQFLWGEGEILVNEIAPRVHNSGHLTMDGCNIDQFEQHWRAVLGEPLGDCSLKTEGAAMVNIIGARSIGEGDLSKVGDQLKKLQSPGSMIYWYDKKGETKGRKLGHINVWNLNSQDALKRALELREAVRELTLL